MSAIGILVAGLVDAQPYRRTTDILSFPPGPQTTESRQVSKDHPSRNISSAFWSASFTEVNPMRVRRPPAPSTSPITFP